MNNKEKPSALDGNDVKYMQVPADFPRPGHQGAVAGTQPKILLTEHKGQIYPAGSAPPEVWHRWDICEDLARQFSAKCLESKAGKRAHLSEVAILDQYLPRLIATGWTSEAEARWIIRRTAAMLQWPEPLSTKEE